MATNGAVDPFEGLLRERIAGGRRRRADVVSEISELQHELEAVDHRLAVAEELYRTEVGHPYDPDAPTASPELRGWEPEGPLTGLTWSDAICTVLESAKTPLHVKEIWARMRDGGFTTTSQDPLRSVVAIAVRAQRIAKAGPNTYYLNGAGRRPSDTGIEGDGATTLDPS